VSILAQTLYDDFVRREGLSDSPRLQVVYVGAINDSLSDLRVEAGYTVDDITSLADTIDLDDELKRTLNRGTRFFMQESGEWTKDTDAISEVKWTQELGRARSLKWDDDPLWDGAHAASS